MVAIKKSLHLFVAFVFALLPLVSNATTVEGSQEALQEAVAEGVHDSAVALDPSSQEFVDQFTQHHLMDDHFYSFYADAEKNKYYGFPLPIILIDNGLKVFFSSEDFVYNGKVIEKGGQHYKYYHGKIYKTDAAGTITYNEKGFAANEKPMDFSITKNVFGLILATVILFLGFTSLAKTYKNSPNNLPKGIARALEPLVIYVRDEMARPNIGDKRYKQYMPYLLSVFFLIFLLNLMGLTPLGLNVTGNIAVTCCLAVFTFLITTFSGNKDYWKHIFWMPGVPTPMKIVLAPIEVIGMITKPFSLMIRLFANITAGHSIVMGIIAVVFVMKQSMGVIGATGISLALGIFITFLELLIAFLQAFIFTMLSSLFIGMAVQEHDEH